MIHLLADVLDRTCCLVVKQYEINSHVVAGYRRAAYALMGSLCRDDDAMEEFSDSRRALWRHVYETLRTPVAWDDKWVQRISGDQSQFVDGFEPWGEELRQRTQAFMTSVKRLRAYDDNPMRRLFRKVVDEECVGRSKAVLLPRARDAHLFHLDGEPLPEGTLLTESELRRLGECRDILITFGRNDHQTPHHIVSAPKWPRILNLRWSGDDDDDQIFPVFPSFLSVAEPSLLPVAPLFTVEKVAVEGDMKVVSEGDDRDEIGDTVGGTGHWSAPHFDDMFMPRRRKTAEKSHNPEGYSGRAAWVALSDGGGFYVGFDDLGVSDSVDVVDPKSRALVRHRIDIEERGVDDGDDDGPWLCKGMTVVLDADRVRIDVDEVRRFDKLRRWKTKLEAQLMNYGAPHVARILIRDYLVAFAHYYALATNLNRWSLRRVGEINAPGDEQAFRALVYGYLGMRHENMAEEEASPWWNEAWQEIEEYRANNLRAGQIIRWQTDRDACRIIHDQYDTIMNNVGQTGGYSIRLQTLAEIRFSGVEYINLGAAGQLFSVARNRCGVYIAPDIAPPDESDEMR